MRPGPVPNCVCDGRKDGRSLRQTAPWRPTSVSIRCDVRTRLLMLLIRCGGLDQDPPVHGRVFEEINRVGEQGYRSDHPCHDEFDPEVAEVQHLSQPQRGRCAGSCRRRRPLADGPRSPLSRRRACSRDRKRASRFERSEGSEENADVLGQEHVLVEDDLAVGDLPRAGNAPQ